MLIFGHRGFYNRNLTENTTPAFERAIEAGADGVELDLRISRDGVPVVVHDENLHRVAGDSRRVRDLTAEELRQVVLRGHGYIPTLNDVTSAIPSPAMFDIEIKDSEVIDPLIRKLKTSAGLRERTVVSSFVLDDLARIRKAVPEVKTLLLLRTWPLPFKGRRVWAEAKEADVWGIGVRLVSVTARRVNWLRKKGWKVATWDEHPLRQGLKIARKAGVDMAILFRF